MKNNSKLTRLINSVLREHRSVEFRIVLENVKSFNANITDLMQGTKYNVIDIFPLEITSYLDAVYNDKCIFNGNNQYQIKFTFYTCGPYSKTTNKNYGISDCIKTINDYLREHNLAPVFKLHEFSKYWTDTYKIEPDIELCKKLIFDYDKEYIYNNLIIDKLCKKHIVPKIKTISNYFIYFIAAIWLIGFLSALQFFPSDDEKTFLSEVLLTIWIMSSALSASVLITMVGRFYKNVQINPYNITLLKSDEQNDYTIQEEHFINNHSVKPFNVIKWVIYRILGKNNYYIPIYKKTK